MGWALGCSGLKRCVNLESQGKERARVAHQRGLKSSQPEAPGSFCGAHPGAPRRRGQLSNALGELVVDETGELEVRNSEVNGSSTQNHAVEMGERTEAQNKDRGTAFVLKFY